MDDECKFDNPPRNCTTHEPKQVGDSLPALCHAAAVALQARVAEQRELAEHHGREALRLEARARELEVKTYEQADLYWRTKHAYDKAVDDFARAEQAVGRLREALRAAVEWNRAELWRKNLPATWGPQAETALAEVEGGSDKETP